MTFAFAKRKREPILAEGLTEEAALKYLQLLRERGAAEHLIAEAELLLKMARARAASARGTEADVARRLSR